MIIFLWLCVILFPLFIGSGILTIVYGKRESYDITLAESSVMGVIACIGISEVVHAIGYFLGWSLESCGKVWGILLASVVTVCTLLTVILYKKAKKRFPVFKKTALPRSGIPFLFIGIVLFQLLYVFCMKAIVVPGDITVETVQSFLSENCIYRVLPLTGQISESGMPLRYAILCLPTLYAMLCQAFGTDAQLVICHIVPVIFLLVMYLGFYHLSGVLFGESMYKKRYLFLLVVAILILFTDAGTASGGYAALHAGYTGTSVRNLILVPYTVAVSLERQWWKAVLCVLAEACITWTFWGLGVCVVIIAGILLITILESKSAKMDRILQIFRKEDLE